MIFRGLGAVILPNGGLLSVRIPLVLAAQLPAEQAGFMPPLIRRTPQHKGVLFPDTAPRKIEPGIVKCFSEVQALGIRMENIDGGILRHVLLHANKSGEQKLVEVLVRHVVIFDFSSGFLHIHIVGWVGQNHIRQLSVHKDIVGFRLGGIATDEAVPPQQPNIAKFRHGWLFQFLIHIKVIFSDFLVVDFGKELLNLWGLKACKIGVEVLGFQIHQQISQQLFIPCTRNFIECYI